MNYIINRLYMHMLVPKVKYNIDLVKDIYEVEESYGELKQSENLITLHDGLESSLPTSFKINRDKGCIEYKETLNELW